MNGIEEEHKDYVLIYGNTWIPVTENRVLEKFSNIKLQRWYAHKLSFVEEIYNKDEKEIIYEQRKHHR